jgi:hypothetical protein
MSVAAKPKISEVQKFVHNLLTDTMHKKRQDSLADAAFGLMNSETLRHQLGEGLAKAKHLRKKHATKQIDRLLFIVAIAYALIIGQI